MATIKEATDKFTNDFIMMKGVYGVGHFPCKCCDKPYIEVSMDTKNAELMKKIPNNYMGFRVEKKQGQQAIPLANVVKDEKKVEENSKDKHSVDITKKGIYIIAKAPITGGYIPEDIGVLLEVKNKPKTIGELKNSERKFGNLEGLLIYLHTKGLISINGITSKNSEDFSNARGGRGGRGGGRRVGVRRVAARRPVARRRPMARPRTGYYGWGVYPYAILPAYAYMYNVNTPNRLKITDRGLEYLKLNPETNVYTYFLTALQSGLIYDERNLVNTLKLGNDYNEVAGWLYGNKLITLA